MMVNLVMGNNAMTDNYTYIFLSYKYLDNM